MRRYLVPMNAFLTRKQRPHRPRAADLLEEFITNFQGSTITLADLLNALGQRAFGVAILVFALANLLIANIPGISTVLGLPLILISLQMVMGRERPWLPQRLAQRAFKRTTFERMIRRSVKVLRSIEKLIKPRLLLLSEHKAERYLGAIAFAMSVVLALPIVFGNWLPAWGLALIALGMIERDGLFIVIGWIFGLLATAYAIAFYTGFAYMLKWLVQYGW